MTGDTYRLIAPRGNAFYVMVVFAVVMSFFAAVFGVGAYRGEGTLWTSALFGILAFGGMAGAMYYRGDAELLLDDYGIRLQRGSRIRKAVPWEEIVEVRFGTRVTSGPRARVVSFLGIKGSRLRDHIDFDGSSYRVLDFEVAEFAALVARKAEDRGIRVRRKDVRRRGER